MSQEISRHEDLYIRTLNRLYAANVLTSSGLISVLKDMCSTCNRTKQIKKIFQMFESLGINILPDILFHKLRFKCIVTIFKVKRVRRCPNVGYIATTSPYIRSIVLSYPRKVIVVMYIPENIDIDKVISASRSGIDIDTHVYNYTVRSKPLPSHLFMMLSGLSDVFGEEGFDACLDNSLQLPEDWDKRPKITGLTLHVLDILSLEPTLTIDEVRVRVSERLGKEVSWHKVKKYIHSASRFIYGYRVSIVKAPNVSDVKLGLVVERLNDSSRFCLSIIRHPLILSCGWGNDEALIYASLPEINLSSFRESLYWFIDQFGGEVVEEFEYIVNRDHVAIVNLPYTEWSSLLKSWRKYEDPLSTVVEKLRESGCIEV